MANTLAPFGFSHLGAREGVTPSFGLAWKQILYTNATPIYFGDPIVSTAAGYVQQAAPGTTQIAGIFKGCEYLDTGNRKVYSPFWPGANAAASGTAWAKFIDDDKGLFMVQANGQVLQSHIGQNANFAIGTGSTTAGGFSGATLDVATIATTTTLPFRIIGFAQLPSFANGADNTSAYNMVMVSMNNVDTKSLTGI